MGGLNDRGWMWGDRDTEPLLSRLLICVICGDREINLVRFVKTVTASSSSFHNAVIKSEQ